MRGFPSKILHYDYAFLLSPSGVILNRTRKKKISRNIQNKIARFGTVFPCLKILIIKKLRDLLKPGEQPSKQPTRKKSPVQTNQSAWLAMKFKIFLLRVVSQGSWFQLSHVLSRVQCPMNLW